MPESWAYDPAGRVESITAGTAHQVSYSPRGPAGRVTTVTDLLDPSLNRTYGYDDAGRLETATGPWGTITYGYDLVGNRTSRTEGACATTYHYTDNRLASLSGCETASYQYDAAGNTESDGSLEYEYSQLGRLDRVLDGGVEVASYTYNAANQRVRKVTAAGTVYYHYDLDGKLLEETDGQGVVLASYLYLPDGRPLGLKIGGNLYHYHLDQLATPRRLTDGAGAVAWSAELLPFGGVWQESGTVEQRLRFPGQVVDGESGLYYNWHRFYGPGIGRYLRADPVGPHGRWFVLGAETTGGPSPLVQQWFPGISGAANSYAYVVQDPVNLTDPSGEFLPLLAGAGALIEAGLTAYDFYDATKTMLDPCAKPVDKAISGGGLLAGAAGPGGLYGVIGKKLRKWLKGPRGRAAPRNLPEKLALDEAQGGAGKPIMQGKINDPKYPEDVWAKMQHVHRNPDGTKTVIHYWENLQTGAREGFKFK